ncbi:MAG: DUF3427 domain-containing protein [Myxococcales bacterium]|nr:DUF3427 domain-containing protein [Myxococcales bacterium]
MARPDRGIYEKLISEAFERELRELAPSFAVDREELRPAEAGDRLALFLARVVESAVESLPEKERVQRGLELVRDVVQRIADRAESAHLRDESPVRERPVLRAVRGLRPDGSVETLEPPLVPLLDTTLLTNAPGEPRVGAQLRSEIDSASRIDIIMAFIRRSGITQFIDGLRRHTERACPLRVLTTVYTGSTELEALEMLVGAGAEVRVSYDIGATRLHAKAWLFHRPHGFSTAYVGSSNLTHSAQVSGLEWNVRISAARNRTLVDKIKAVFDAYWEGGDFVPFDATEFRSRSEATRTTTRILLPATEIRLEPFQERLLEQVEVAREAGHHRNLIAAATGTGKTVMAAVDYARLRDRLPRSRLLFVAHRVEILEASQATYAHALRDPGFGETWTGGRKPQRWDHVFASVQSIQRGALDHLARDHFDVVVVDEFHHAAAASYRTLLEYVAPRELLGLTATPERSDGLPILDWFDGRIAAELRLWDAIDQGRLAPFEYYGLHDGVDLTKVPWRRGRGYESEALTNLYTSNEAWVRFVLKELSARAEDLASMRALGFCVSVEHARFMARQFEKAGVRAVAVWSDSTEAERREALDRLRRGEIQVLFSVDLFNEGVDLPNVDTLLFLRPTDSPVLFLQQLGRGLRRHGGKRSCLVLDFVGLHRREFRFDQRFQALLGGSRKHVAQQVESGFPFLPAGCHMELEPRAREIVLESIRQSVPSRSTERAAELRRLAAEGASSLGAFLESSGLSIEDVYQGTSSWSDLREAAGLATLPSGPHEVALRRACGRLLHVDDRERLDAHLALLSADRVPRIADPTSRSARLARMLIASVVGNAAGKAATLGSGLALLWEHPQVRAELVELLSYLRERIDHRHHPLPDALAAVPLRVHARYSRVEITAALAPKDSAFIAPFQQGVYWAKASRAGALAFTLDKTSGQFSPTTRYRDYAVSRSLIHWESQSATREQSETGLLYREHEAQGWSILLFARERTDDRSFWFLGPATYQRHEGELPMAITWKLAHPLPGDLYASFAAAVA